MRKFTIIILLALTLTGCETIKTEDTEEYQYGYEVGNQEGYKAGYEDGYNDALSNIDYDIIHENYSISDFYEDDELIEYLEDHGYVVVPEEEYSDRSSTTELFYIGNMNTHVFHRPDCKSVSKMKTTNIKRASREELINSGYEPCENCNP